MQSAVPKLYNRLKYDLDNDPKVCQEVALGKRVGFYRMRGQLGVGNFAKVKMGLHLLTHEKVAIKIIDKSKLDDQARKLLSREITCMETLDHPNIIRLYEVIESFSTLHLIMEVAGAGDLQARLAKEGAMTEDEARPIFAQITAAIKHMHHKGVIHRDLKAENVFFASSKQIKIGDFGFSTQSTQGSLLDTFCGSPPYAAPELFSEEKYYGHLVDIWAMGVTLYFMLSATMPFKGDTIPQMKAVIQEGKYSVLEKTSYSCQALVAGLLTVDPSNRWTMSDICGCDWMKTEKDALLSQTSINELTIRISSENGMPDQNKPEANSVDLDVLSQLERLGAPVANRTVFTGEPRNSLAGAYRILLHRKDLAPGVDEVGKDEECQNRTIQSQNATSPKTTITSKEVKQKSKFCTIL